MASFGERLKQLREERGMTQEEVAKILDVTKVAISGYERGVRHPRFDILDNLADYFDVDINYMSGVSDKRKQYPRMTPEEQDRLHVDYISVDITVEEFELVKAYRRLDEYSKKLTRMAARIDEK